MLSESVYGIMEVERVRKSLFVGWRVRKVVGVVRSSFEVGSRDGRFSLRREGGGFYFFFASFGFRWIGCRFLSW